MGGVLGNRVRSKWRRNSKFLMGLASPFHRHPTCHILLSFKKVSFRGPFCMGSRVPGEVETAKKLKKIDWYDDPIPMNTPHAVVHFVSNKFVFRGLWQPFCQGSRVPGEVEMAKKRKKIDGHDNPIPMTPYMPWFISFQTSSFSGAVATLLPGFPGTR